MAESRSRGRAACEFPVSCKNTWIARPENGLARVRCGSCKEELLSGLPLHFVPDLCHQEAAKRNKKP
jgi:hypothetical protein